MEANIGSAIRKGNTHRERKLIFIMSMHLLVIWSLSTWSYSGTASGEAIKNIFRFASTTIPKPVGYNWWVMIIAPVILLVGAPTIYYLLKRWYCDES